jgi:spermidine synthase
VSLPSHRSASDALPGRRLLAVCFFLSGVGSLALEVVWTRQLRLVFGSTTLAASTILVAYMLGLGIGGLVGGRVAGRLRDGVRAYGWMEIAIGVYALAVPWLLLALPHLDRGLLHGLSFWPAMLCRFAVALLLLLVPTVLMGATLPILVAALVRRDPRVARSTGLLYGLNTLGAVAGVFLATFVLFPTLGLARTNAFGALLDVAVGVVALVAVAGRVGALRDAPDETAVDGGDRRAALLPVGALLATYATVGFTALLYEIAWTRALAVVLGSSIYAFSSMLGAFLTGIALGSLLFRRWIDRTERPLLLLEGGLVALAGLGLLTTLALPHLPGVLLAWMRAEGLASTRIVAAQIGLSMLAMLPATLILGGLFPLVARLLAHGTRDAGEAVGRVYFANTVGSATGAFCTGFILIPWIGLRDTLAVGAIVNLSVAGLLLLATRREGRGIVPGLALLAVAAVLCVVPIPFDRTALTRGVFRSPESALDFGLPFLPLDGIPQRELLYYRDGLNSTVSVERDEGSLALRVNGKIDASDFADMPTQVLLGQVPLLFGPPAKKVLVIGYASGVTTGSVARHRGVERIDAVEIEPAIMEASRFFEARSGRPLDDPRVTLILDDARAYLSSTRERYDVIISEPSNPWMSGVSNLFTREFFRIAHRALEPGGRLLQWVQLYSLEPDALASILAAVSTEFAHVYAFAHVQNSPDMLLLATDRPLTRDDLPRWENLDPTVRSDLQRIGTLSTEDLWTLVRLLPEHVTQLAARAEAPNTDDNLRIELDTPRMLHVETVLPNWASFEELAPRGVHPLLERVGEPLDENRLGRLALSYVQRRGAAQVATNLLKPATASGANGPAIAAAVLVAREIDTEGRLSAADLLASLDEAVALSPRDPDVLVLRGDLALEADRPVEALANAESALGARPDDLLAAALRVRALERLGRADEARARLQPLLGTPVVEFDPELLQLEGQLAAATGDHQVAVRALRGYLEGRNANWPGGWRLLAESEAALGRADAAAVASENADRTVRNQARLLHRRAREAAWRGHDARSAELLDMVLLLEPDNAAARTDRDALARRAGADPQSR